MLKSLVAGLSAVACLAVAAPASATVYAIHVTGTVDGPVAPGAGFTPGQVLTLDAIFDDLHTLPGDTPGTYVGYTHVKPGGYAAYFSGPTAPYVITLGPWTWGPGYDLNAGQIAIYGNYTSGSQLVSFYQGGPVPTDRDFRPDIERVVYYSPNVLFTPTEVLGIFNFALINFATQPWPELRSDGSTFAIHWFPTPSGYTGGDLTGHWDLANATVTALGAAVPEPATWGLMILGMGLVGAAMRRRSKSDTALRPSWS